MKKLFVAASLLVASFAVNAQDEPSFTSKNGHEVLPQAGDFGISFDAIPVLNYVGNAFNGDNNNTISSNAPFAPFTNLNTTGTAFAVPTITLRKMLDGSTAARVRAGFGIFTNSAKTFVVANPATTPTTYVEDVTKTKASTFYLSAGLEKRRGSTRVQGIYGAELVLGIVADPNVTYEYGNALSATNVGPRLTEEKFGNTFIVGPRGFVGAEYFIAPKVSLGGEFGLGLYYEKTGESEQTEEEFVGGAVQTTTTPTGAGGSQFTFGTDNFNASINLNFFF